MEEDTKNYVRFKLMGGKIVMKRDVPHIFKCQPGRKRTDVPIYSLPVKRQRKCLLKDAQAANENRVVPSTSKFLRCCYNFLITMLIFNVFRYVLAAGGSGRNAIRILNDNIGETEKHRHSSGLHFVASM